MKKKSIKCFSKKEVEKILADKGIKGETSLGVALVGNRLTYMWRCVDQKHKKVAYAPFDKHDTNLGVANSFTPFTEEYFIYDGFYYYIDAENKIWEMEVLTTEEEAKEFLSLALYKTVKKVAPCIAKIHNGKEFLEVPCWFTCENNKTSIIPMFEEDFNCLIVSCIDRCNLSCLEIPKNGTFHKGLIMWQAAFEKGKWEIKPVSLVQTNTPC